MYVLFRKAERGSDLKGGRLRNVSSDKGTSMKTATQNRREGRRIKITQQQLTRIRLKRGRNWVKEEYHFAD